MKKKLLGILSLVLVGGMLMSCGSTQPKVAKKDVKTEATAKKPSEVTKPDQITKATKKGLEKKQESDLKQHKDCKNYECHYIATVFATNSDTKEVIPMTLIQEAPKKGDTVTIYGHDYPSYYEGSYWKTLYSDGTGYGKDVSTEEGTIGGYGDTTLKVLLHDMKQNFPGYTFTADSTDLSKKLMKEESIASLTDPVEIESADATLQDSGSAAEDTQDTAPEQGQSSAPAQSGDITAPSADISTGSSDNGSGTVQPEDYESIGRAAIEAEWNKVAPQYNGTFQYTGAMTYSGDPSALVLIFPVRITLNGQDQGDGRMFFCTVVNPQPGLKYDSLHVELSPDGGAPVGMTQDDL